MRGLARFCLMTAVLYALSAMSLGIYMAASHDHMLAPAHAHLNLVGWVSVSLYGLYYHTVPSAALGKLPKIQVGLATVGVVFMAPGIALAILDVTEALAGIGSILTILSMLLFAVIVVRSRPATA